MKQTILVQKDSRENIKFIQYDLVGATLTREWGRIGGVVQGTSHTYETINAGKSNELSPELAALEDLQRILKQKKREGYVETESLTNLPELPDYLEVFDFDNVPKEFCCSKPIASITIEELAANIKNKNMKFFIKYNGLCHYVVINSNSEVKLYTRRWHDRTAKYPELVQAVKEENYPPNSMLIVELTIDPLKQLPHMLCFKYMSQIDKTETVKGEMKEKQDESIKLQKENPVKIAVYGILYYNGNKLWSEPYGTMYDLIKETTPLLSQNKKLFIPQEVNLTDAKQIMETVKAHKEQFEGFMGWDLAQAMEVTMNGKPKRKAAWKIKAKGEMDVIAYGSVEGKGKLQGKIGAIKIGKYDIEGRMVSLGTIGGLKPNEGQCEESYWSFPCVIEVTYDNIQPGTQKFQFGVFSKIHEDKTLEEVDIFLPEQE